jgi:hypothetical protein
VAQLPPTLPPPLPLLLQGQQRGVAGPPSPLLLQAPQRQQGR